MNIGVVLQTNTSSFESERLADTLLSLGEHVDVAMLKYEYAGLGKVFSWDPLSQVGITGVMGSIHFARNTKDWFIGDGLAPFFNVNLHHYHKYIHQIPLTSRLNSKAIMLPRRDIKLWGFDAIAKLLLPNETNELQLFSRPDQALKVCEAATFGADGFDSWYDHLEKRTGTSDSSLMWLAPMQNIKTEYRCLVSQGELKSISSYGFECEPVNIDGSALFGVIERFLAPIISSIHEMDPAYILDVAELGTGELKVVELNCLSTSGLYELNYSDVANALVDGLRMIHREWYCAD